MDQVADNQVSRAFLIDLDGVVYTREKLIPGASEVISLLQKKNIPFRFVTNTSTVTRSKLISSLSQAGVVVDPEHLFTSPVAAAAHLRGLPKCTCFFLVDEGILEEFHPIPSVEENPTHIVIGDVGEKFTYDTLNRVFRMVMDGARMIALQKNRFWLTIEGLKLDAGAFITALEYATGSTAEVFGKPSPHFFHKACESLGVPSSEVTMIGDDLVADIAGARAAGLHTIFVRSGKDREKSLDDLMLKPDMVLDSLADLSGIL